MRHSNTQFPCRRAANCETKSAITITKISTACSAHRLTSDYSRAARHGFQEGSDAGKKSWLIGGLGGRSVHDLRMHGHERKEALHAARRRRSPDSRRGGGGRTA